MSRNKSHYQQGGNAARGWLCFLVFLAAAVIVFFCGRYAGISQGLHDAREKITAEHDITAGPESLIR